MKKVTPLLLGIAAAICLAEALLLAWNDRVPAAALAAGMFVVTVIFLYFPLLDSFSAFSISVKLRARLHEAEEVVQNLRRLAVVAAQQNFVQMAEAGRFGGGSSNAEKRNRSLEYSEVLEELGVDKQQIVNARRPLVAYAGLDMLLGLRGMAATRIQAIRQSLEQERASIFGSEPVRMEGPQYEEWLELGERIKLLDLTDSYLEIINNSSPENFAKLCNDIIATPGFSKQDQERLRRFSKEITAMYKRMYKAGIVTPEVATLLDERVRDYNGLFREYFPE
jgi:hypothetical protein